jgi:hypothetical protein
MIKRMSRIRLFMVLAAALIVVALAVGGAISLVSWLNDQLEAPGIPGATGSGPCSSGDAVNLEFVFADGQLVQACTHDRPKCSNQTVNGIINGQSQSRSSQFTLSNQLRSSSRRYILFIRSDMAIGADMPERILAVDQSQLVKGPPGTESSNSATTGHAVIEVTPRDHSSWAYIPGSGTIPVSSVQGVVRGTIDANISSATRSDRPQPSTGPVPVNITGSFACNQ